jgi:predicted RND superfamily exporter protein
VKLLYGILSGILLAIVVSGLMKLRLDSDIMGIFPQAIPEVQGLQSVRTEFMNEGELIVVMHDINEEQIISLASHLMEKNVVKQARWRAQWLDDPQTMADLLAYLWWNGSEESVKSMTDRLSKDNSQIWLEKSMESLATSLEGQDMAIAARDPFDFMSHPALDGLKDSGVSDSFSSADGKTRLLFLQHKQLPTGHAAAQQWIDEVNREIQQWSEKTSCACNWQMTGDPAFVAEIGGAMEYDMKSSTWVTALIVAGLLYVALRRFLAVGGLLFITLGSVVCSLGIASWLIGELSLLACGSAAILTGLIVDFGIMIALASQQEDAKLAQTRAQLVRPIFWAAATTVLVFACLGLSGIPGLRQLGILVALGVSIGALAMLLFFAPLAQRLFRQRALVQRASGMNLSFPRKMGLSITAVIVLICVGILGVKGLPAMHFDPSLLKPKQSQASAAYDSLCQSFPEWGMERVKLVVTANDDEEMLEKINKLADMPIDEAKHDFAQGKWWWPDAARQKSNAQQWSSVRGEIPRLMDEGDAAGYATEGLVLARAVLERIETYTNQENLWVFPDSAATQEVMKRYLNRHESGGGALLITLHGEEKDWSSDENYAPIREVTQEHQLGIASWALLRKGMQPLVNREVYQLLIPLSVVLMLLAIFMFRNAKDTMVLLLAMIFATLLLLTVMSLMGMRWNVINLAAAPLFLGTGIDYGIHMIFAKRHCDVDHETSLYSVQKGVIFCALTTIIGFGSLALSSTEGLSSFGIVVALGVASSAFTSVVLLPSWRKARD